MLGLIHLKISVDGEMHRCKQVPGLQEEKKKKKKKMKKKKKTKKKISGKLSIYNDAVTLHTPCTYLLTYSMEQSPS